MNPAAAAPEPAPRWFVLLGLVAVGGALGTLARHLVDGWLGGVASWPVETVVVNIAGAFALGGLLEVVVRRGPGAPHALAVRFAVGAGFLGAFTTYSALAVQTVQLLRSDQVLLGAGFAIGSVLLGLAAAIGGVAAGAGLHRRRGRRP